MRSNAHAFFHRHDVDVQMKHCLAACAFIVLPDLEAIGVGGFYGGGGHFLDCGHEVGQHGDIRVQQSA